MDTRAIVKQTVLEEYGAGGGLNLALLPLANEEKGAYGVVLVETPQRRDEALMLVLVRLVGEYIVIEEDHTDDPLWLNLMQKGIPREKIIRAYLGEPLPDELQQGILA